MNLCCTFNWKKDKELDEKVTNLLTLPISKAFKVYKEYKLPPAQGLSKIRFATYPMAWVLPMHNHESTNEQIAARSIQGTFVNFVLSKSWLSLTLAVEKDKGPGHLTKW